MTDKSNAAEPGRRDLRKSFGQGADAMCAGASAPHAALDAIFKAMHNLDLSLGHSAEDIRESQRLLASSFGDMALHFAQIHGIAAAAGEREGALNELRSLADALVVELQIEDSLNQLLGHALGRIESISLTLNQTRSMVEGAWGAQDEATRGNLVVAALLQAFESLGNAERARAEHRFDATPGSIDMF